MKKVLQIAVLILTVQSGLFAQTNPKDNNKAYITNQVEVKGLVENATTLTIETLKNMKMKVKEGNEVKITGSKGDIKKEFKTFKGVLLKDIISDAVVKMGNPKEKGKYIAVVSASDGYTVIFTYNELFFGAAGDNTYLVFEENGSEIKEDGKFVMFCSTDKITGPRHVKWVKTIEIKKID